MYVLLSIEEGWRELPLPCSIICAFAPTRNRMSNGGAITGGLSRMMPPSRMSRQYTGGTLQEDMVKSGSDDPCHGEVDSGVNVCMIGTGEYTTGYVYGQPADSDKSAGGESQNR